MPVGPKDAVDLQKEGQDTCNGIVKKKAFTIYGNKKDIFDDLLEPAEPMDVVVKGVNEVHVSAGGKVRQVRLQAA